jgi:uncharacterized protein with ParB-like and HNH nuclease domain
MRTLFSIVDLSICLENNDIRSVNEGPINVNVPITSLAYRSINSFITKFFKNYLVL